MLAEGVNGAGLAPRMIDWPSTSERTVIDDAGPFRVSSSRTLEGKWVARILNECEK